MKDEPFLLALSGPDNQLDEPIFCKPKVIPKIVNEKANCSRKLSTLIFQRKNHFNQYLLFAKKQQQKKSRQEESFQFSKRVG